MGNDTQITELLGLTDGIIKHASGVLARAVPNTDYMAALAGTGMQKVVAGVPTLALPVTDFAFPFEWANHYTHRLTYTRLGLTSLGAVKRWHFTPQFLYSGNIAGGGTYGPDPADAKGGLLAATGALAGAETGWLWSGFQGSGTLGQNPQHFPAGSTGVWGMAFEFKMDTAIDAQTTLRNQIRVGNAPLQVGANGAVSTTKISARFEYAGATYQDLISTVDLGIGVWNTVELWRVGGIGYLSVNGETPISHANAFPLTTNGGLAFIGGNGTTAANRQGGCREVVIVVPT